MRYLLSRIIKNFPPLERYWIKYLEYLDFKYYDKFTQEYIIIPFGEYCLPRVMTKINRFKPTKKYGEKSYPFDLCFSELDSNIKLFSEHFKDLYENMEFDDNNKYWVNQKYGLSFNHDYITLEEFKNIYNNRIENLYSALNNKDRHLYFIIASFKSIEKRSIETLTEEINKYRTPDTYDIIIINQSNHRHVYEYSNVHCINLCFDKYFRKINKDGDWVNEIKEMRNINARIFNHKIKSKLSKIIKTRGK